MVLQYKGSAGTPGPLGTTPGTPPRGLYGPLSFKEVNAATTSPTRASKSLPMPVPWHSSTIIRAAVVGTKLSDGAPVTKQVRQGSLPNCPIAAILAALGNTKDGQRYLDTLITQFSGTTVKTSLSGDVMAKLIWADEDVDDKPQAKELTSQRYFVVTLKAFKKPIEVHDTFYVEYTDGPNLQLVYMNSPSDVLWPSVIEKACALHYGSYPAMSDYNKIKVDDFWELLLGSRPNPLVIEDSTDIEKIRDAARAAPRIPTMAASRTVHRDGHLAPIRDGSPITPWHGFAVLGMTGKNIDLYDPAKAKVISITFEEFRSDFQRIYSGGTPS
jgi:hypothetical protein